MTRTHGQSWIQIDNHILKIYWKTTDDHRKVLLHSFRKGWCLEKGSSDSSKTSKEKTHGRKKNTVANPISQMTKKEIEDILQIPSKTNEKNAAEKFLDTKQKFYAERKLLTNLLEYDLERLEHDRSENFKRRMTTFTYTGVRPLCFWHINHRVENDVCWRNASHETSNGKVEKERHGTDREWSCLYVPLSHTSLSLGYFDMIEKLITTSRKEKLSDTEILVYDFIKGYVPTNKIKNAQYANK